MPKLYEYFGLVILFYSNEHEPVHVHGLYQGQESKAELIIENGAVISIQFSDVKGRRSLDAANREAFQMLVKTHADDIVRKWIDYFVLHKSVHAEKITRRIK